jgi:hypothetical protein
MTYKAGPSGVTKTLMTQVSLSSDTAFTSGTAVPLDTITTSNSSLSGVSMSSNVITLQAGDYVIFGAVAIDRSLNTDSYVVDFYDNSTSTILPISDGWMGAKSVEQFASDSQVLQAQVRLTSSLSFYLYSVGASGTIKADGTYLIILEV